MAAITAQVSGLSARLQEVQSASEATQTAQQSKIEALMATVEKQQEQLVWLACYIFRLFCAVSLIV